MTPQERRARSSTNTRYRLCFTERRGLDRVAVAESCRQALAAAALSASDLLHLTWSRQTTRPRPAIGL